MKTKLIALLFCLICSFCYAQNPIKAIKLAKSQTVPFDSAAVIDLTYYRTMKHGIDHQQATCDSIVAQCQTNNQAQQALTEAHGQERFRDGQKTKIGYEIATVALGLLEFLTILSLFAK
jgi:formate hydrogenlyase subunit 6/NADH:ubiquinone oxidoreductase subunit I